MATTMLIQSNLVFAPNNKLIYLEKMGCTTRAYKQHINYPISWNQVVISVCPSRSSQIYIRYLTVSPRYDSLPSDYFFIKAQVHRLTLSIPPTCRTPRLKTLADGYLDTRRRSPSSRQSISSLAFALILAKESYFHSPLIFKWSTDDLSGRLRTIFLACFLSLRG